MTNNKRPLLSLLQIPEKKHLPQQQELMRRNELICPGEAPLVRGQKSSNSLRASDVGETCARSLAENSAKVHLATSPGNFSRARGVARANPKALLPECADTPTDRVRSASSDGARHCERQSDRFEQSSLSTFRGEKEK